jgi:hypothetical protein
MADVHGPTGCHSTRKSFAERAFVELGRDLHHLQALWAIQVFPVPLNTWALIDNSSIGLLGPHKRQIFARRYQQTSTFHPKRGDKQQWTH